MHDNAKPRVNGRERKRDIDNEDKITNEIEVTLLSNLTSTWTKQQNQSQLEHSCITLASLQGRYVFPLLQDPRSTMMTGVWT